MSDIDTLPAQPEQRITLTDIDYLAQGDFLDYAASVIADRSLPEVRDGLKPVHRRILNSSHELHLGPKTPHKKSARIVGDVLGKYHPHGDTAVYDALVRMAQDFTLRLPLIDGQGNFGSIDGDSAAAMRYTESRLSVAGESFFDDIALDTVDYTANFDGSLTEPTVLPVLFPNLVINGTEGIAVGMAAKIPPHNPNEIMDVVDYMVDKRISAEQNGENKSLALFDLDAIIKLAPAPDFPTGAIVHSVGGTYRSAWVDGSGRVVMRGRWHEEKINGHRSIVITELPYQLNKNSLTSRIVELAKPDVKNNNIVRIEGIHTIRDESDKEGVRLVIEVKRGVEPEFIVNNLIKQTSFEMAFNYNVTVIQKGRPRKIGLIECLDNYIDHRVETIVRRTRTLDRKAADRMHILDALIKAVDPDMLDTVVRTIRQSYDHHEANAALQALLAIDEIQAAAILDLRLQKLTGLQIESLQNEYTKLEEERAYYATILNNVDSKQLRLVKEEAVAFRARISRLKTKDGRNLCDRLSEVSYDIGDVDFEAIIPKEMCGVLLSENNYIRRVPIGDFGLQGRGTRGKAQFKLSDEDKVVSSCQAFSHDLTLLFTDGGRCYAVKTYEISDHLKGRFVANIISLKEGERIIQVLSISDFNDDNLMFVTENGVGKRIPLSEISGSTRKSGVSAITLKDGDKLVQVNRITEDDDVIILAENGKTLHFKAPEIRPMGRNAAGVIAMDVGNSHVVGFCVAHPDDRILTVTEKGKGSAFDVASFPIRKRAGKGVYAMSVSEKTGNMKRIMAIPDGAQMVSISENGVGNRIAVDTLRSAGRGNSGVSLMNIDTEDNFGSAFIWVEEV